MAESVVEWSKQQLVWRASYSLFCCCLPAGVAESVVEWSKQHSIDIVVVGSRGMGAVKSTFMSLVGLGSVSGEPN